MLLHNHQIKLSLHFQNTSNKSYFRPVLCLQQSMYSVNLFHRRHLLQFWNIIVRIVVATINPSHSFFHPSIRNVHIGTKVSQGNQIRPMIIQIWKGDRFTVREYYSSRRACRNTDIAQPPTILLGAIEGYVGGPFGQRGGAGVGGIRELG